MDRWQGGQDAGEKREAMEANGQKILKVMIGHYTSYPPPPRTEQKYYTLLKSLNVHVKPTASNYNVKGNLTRKNK